MKNFNVTQVKKLGILKAIGYFAYYLGIITTALYFGIELLPTFLLVIFSSFIFLIDLADNKQKKYKQGEDGELTVDKLLRETPNLKYFRDVSIGEDAKWNIDFVVVAPAGVFVLEVKAYEGRITAKKDAWFQFRNGRRNVLPSFSNQAKSNSVNLIKYMKEKYPDVHFSFFRAVVVLAKPFDKNDIDAFDCNYIVVSPDELVELLGTEGQLNVALENSFDKEFGTGNRD